MGQGDPCIGRAPRGRGDAGHHLERNAEGREGLDLLPAAAEDERIAALEPQHPLAGEREPGEEIVDLVLRDRVVTGLLPGVDSLGVAPRQIEHRVRHQAVVDDDVRLLHEPQGPEREQVRVAGSSPDQVHLAGRARALVLGERRRDRVACLVLASGEHLLSDGAVHHAFEEPAAPRGVGDPSQHVGPDLAEEPGEPSELGRDDGLQARAQDAGEDGRGTAGRDRRDQGRAIEDRGEDERAQRPPIHRVDRNAPLPGGRRDGACERLVVHRDDHEPHAVQVTVAKRSTVPRDTDPAGQLSQSRGEVGRHDDEPRAGPQQEPGLGLGRLRAADQQAGLAPDGEEDRQVVHGARCLAVYRATGRPFERPGRIRSSASTGACRGRCRELHPRVDISGERVSAVTRHLA